MNKFIAFFKGLYDKYIIKKKGVSEREVLKK